MPPASLSHLATAALLAVPSPLAGLDGEHCDVHEIPRFVVERVELPSDTRADCLQKGSPGPSCPALGVSGTALQHGNPAAPCLPQD
jgi:hypothetical protein